MSLFTPNIATIDNYYDRGRFLLAWRISLSFSIIFFILATIYILSNATAMVPTSITFVVTASSTLYLKITKNFKPLFWIYAISGTLLAQFAMNYVLDFTHYVDFVWIIASILLAFIGLGPLYGVVFIVANSIGIAYFFWFTLNTHIETLQPKTNLELTGDYVEMIFSFFVIAYLLRQFVLFQEYSKSELQKANKDLAEQNKLILAKNLENETLVKEIHHRVKNNLQIVVSLLRMQKSDLQSEEVQKQFNEAIKRIMVMSLIHQKLYNEKQLSSINLKEYLGELVEETKTVSVGSFPVEINIVTDVDNVGLKTVVPLGLLINELLSNSFKYAFQHKDSGKIDITICQQEDDYTFEYKDNGEWIEPDKNHTSFGLELIQILTEQLEGTVSKENKEEGTTYSFKLKNLDLK